VSTKRIAAGILLQFSCGIIFPIPYGCPFVETPIPPLSPLNNGLNSQGHHWHLPSSTPAEHAAHPPDGVMFESGSAQSMSRHKAHVPGRADETLARESIMKTFLVRSLSIVISASLALLVDASPGHALGIFGTHVDTFCQSYNGTTPFADQSCAPCHVNGVPPASNSTGIIFKNNGFAPSAAMCPVKNTAPVANADQIRASRLARRSR
jgi:hypothetical protein